MAPGDNERTRGIFTGDTFGIAYKDLDTDQGPLLFAPTTPVAFDPDAWQRSLDRLMALEPQVAFLTHFCQLDRPADHIETLRQSIRDLAAMALAEEGAADEGRPARLKGAVDAYLLRRARENGCDLPDEQIRAVLAVDIELNAQGLEVWLRRRAKAGRQSLATPEGRARAGSALESPGEKLALTPAVDCEFAMRRGNRRAYSFSRVE